MRGERRGGEGGERERRDGRGERKRWRGRER